MNSKEKRCDSYEGKILAKIGIPFAQYVTKVVALRSLSFLKTRIIQQSVIWTHSYWKYNHRISKWSVKKKDMTHTKKKDWQK